MDLPLKGPACFVFIRIFFPIFLLLVVPTTQAASFTGKVVRVSDGDTITVQTAGNREFKIRLLGIDSPESAQAHGDKATQAMTAKVFGQLVSVHWEKRDDYKRVLGHVAIGQRWINHEMVAEGWAWHYKQYSKDQRLAVAETRAKATRRGLWANRNPVAPWDWRKMNSGKKNNAKKPVPPSVNAVGKSSNMTGALRIAALLPNPKGKDVGNEQVLLMNLSNIPVTLRGWSLWDKKQHDYALSGSIPAYGRIIITLRGKDFPMNNDGDTIFLKQGSKVKHKVSYTEAQAGDGAVIWFK